jgi:hypothetical protein
MQMKIVIKLLLVLVVALTLPMATCWGITQMNVPGGGSVCGHNAGFQMLSYLVIGIIIVIATSFRRPKP